MRTEGNPFAPPEAKQDGMVEPEDLAPILTYWEGRRWLFNVAVGGTGIVMIALLNLSELMHPVWMVFEAALYGLAANVGYCLGPYLNVLAVSRFGFPNVAWKSAFALGTACSVVLTAGLALLAPVVHGAFPD